MTDLHCPNCGSAVEPELAVIKLTSCRSCGTSLFLDDAQARLAGDQGVMHDAPLLFGIGDRAKIGRDWITFHGHARFSYGRGFWDEFWGTSEEGTPQWVSIDEGDVILQTPIPQARWPKGNAELPIGASVHWDRDLYTVTEVDTATCIALCGSFDEALTVNEVYRFINATSVGGRMLSGEFWPGGQAWFEGRWLDPFDLTLDHAG